MIPPAYLVNTTTCSFLAVRDASTPRLQQVDGRPGPAGSEVHVPVRDSHRLVPGQLLDAHDRRAAHRQVGAERVAELVPLGPGWKPGSLLLTLQGRAHVGRGQPGPVLAAEHQLPA